jgi:hypothetical protein
MREEFDDDSFIIEFLQIGNAVKVTAVDPVTLREVCIVGATGATREQLADLAVRKLRYVLNRGGEAEA